MSNNVFSNGNSTNYSDSNSANLGTRETGIIEKLLVKNYFILLLLYNLLFIFNYYSILMGLYSAVSARPDYFSISANLLVILNI